ncbi:MAG: tetratricopeptide repeat protein [Acidobacteria bacterium]|nr:tetratricopeptide repeat protein [Acidobacteriota bacterium]
MASPARLSLISLCLSATLTAQMPMPAHCPMPMAPQVPAKDLPAPIPMTGIGNGHITITATPEAQRWFDQGLNLLHDFWDYESARAFQQSIRVDPNCAMCWWGLAQAIGFRGIEPNAQEISADLDQAKKLSKHTTKAEQLYIKAAIEENKEREKPNKKSSSSHDDVQPTTHKDAPSTKTWRKLAALDPQEIQPRIFLAGSVQDGFFHGDPNPGTRESMTILQQLIKEHPDDSASLHYWIHVIEPGHHPELARDAAERLGTLVPSSGHMVHMPGHIFYLLGDYDRAQASFAASTRVDEAYMQAQHVSPDDDWNYVHNLMYAIANLVEAGHFAAADQLAQRTIAAHGTRPETLYVSSPRDGMARLHPSLPSALRSGNWAKTKALLEKSSAPAILANLQHLRQGLLFYADGMLALDNGNTADAGRFSTQLAALITSLETKATSTEPHDPRDLWKGSAKNFLNVASVELTASVEEAEGKTADADRDFAKALTLEEKLGYREPPSYLRPVAEAQADALFRAHRYAEARAAYEAAQKKRPNSGFSLYGIARCEEAIHDAGTSAAYQNFLDAWHSADGDLPQIQHAQRWLMQHAPANGL